MGDNPMKSLRKSRMWLCSAQLVGCFSMIALTFTLGTKALPSYRGVIRRNVENELGLDRSIIRLSTQGYVLLTCILHGNHTYIMTKAKAFEEENPDSKKINVVVYLVVEDCVVTLINI